MKLPIHKITYDNVVCDKGRVMNLQYPVAQKDLDALQDRLPRFCNSMGELFLLTSNMKAWVNNVEANLAS